MKQLRLREGRELTHIIIVRSGLPAQSESRVSQNCIAYQCTKEQAFLGLFPLRCIETFYGRHSVFPLQA